MFIIGNSVTIGSKLAKVTAVTVELPRNWVTIHYQSAVTVAVASDLRGAAMTDSPSAVAGQAREIDPPPTSLSALYAGADLLDAFAIGVPASADADVDTLARIACEHPAWWIRLLNRLRDALVAPAGVKSTRMLAAAAHGRALGFFPVLSQTANEIVVGADDRHLDFRAAIALRVDDGGRRELVAVTVVHCHNRFGRCYLAAITPFHRLIVKANMERAVRTVQRADSERVSA
jgi:hypothetical protein